MRKKGPNGDRNKHTHTHTERERERDRKRERERERERELKQKEILEFARSFFSSEIFSEFDICSESSIAKN